MKKICTIGSATQDIFLLYAGAQTAHLHNRTYLILEQGHKIDIPAIHTTIGGGALNTAAGFSRLGIPVEPFCKIGTDPEAEFIKTALQKKNISTEMILEDSTLQTARTIVIPSEEQNHVALCYRGANKKLVPEDIPAFKDIDLLYITALSGNSEQLFSHLCKLGIPIAANPSSSQVQDASFVEQLNKIDTLILNAYEASLLYNTIKLGVILSKGTKKPQLLEQFVTYKGAPLSIKDYFKDIQALGPSICVVTNGAEGVYMATPEGIYFHPSIPCTPVCGLGAGDAFCSAFVGSMLLGNDPKEALSHGVANATSVIQYPDAQEGLLSLEELEKTQYLSISYDATP